MTDTLKAPLFDLAHMQQDDIKALRRDVITRPSMYASLRRLGPWALGVVLIGFAGLAYARLRA